MKYIPKEKTIRKRKFTDKEYLELYKKGLSDSAIAKIFRCSNSAVNVRRTRLHLVSNFKSFSGKQNDVNDLIKAESKMSDITTRLNKQKKYKDIKKKWAVANKEYIKDYNTTYLKKPEVKESKRCAISDFRKTPKYQIWKKEYFSKEEVVDRIKDYERTKKVKNRRKKYRDNNKEKIAKQHKEYNNRADVKAKKKEYLKGYREKNREKLRKYNTEWKKKLKAETLKA